MTSTPFMQLYPADYIAKTMDLTTEQHGAYLLILMTMWQHDAKLPSDPKKLARIARMTPAKFRPVWEEVSRFFVEADGFISNARLTKERKKAHEKSEKRAIAGSAGGKAKALKDKASASSNCHADAMASSSDTRNQSKKEDTYVSLSVEPTLPDLAHVDDVAEAVAEYNRTAAEAGWPILRILSKQRRAALNARMRDAGGIEGWRAAMSKARASPHLCGQNDRGWVASFDFLTKQSSFTKLMEGNYDARRSSRPDNRSASGGHATDRAIAFAARARRSSGSDCF